MLHTCLQTQPSLCTLCTFSHEVLWLHAEIPGKQNSLALAVLYYVAPDSGFTLDILQWTPQDKTLSVKYRLQLHELTDMFDFLLGSLVLDMCAVRNCQSGELGSSFSTDLRCQQHHRLCTCGKPSRMSSSICKLLQASGWMQPACTPVTLCYEGTAETLVSTHISPESLSYLQVWSATSGAGACALQTLHGVKHMLHVCTPITLGLRHLGLQAICVSNAAGLVLLFETGLVLFDLADIVDGGPNTPAGTVIHQNRGEWLLAPVLTHSIYPALWTF